MSELTLKEARAVLIVLHMVRTNRTIWQVIERLLGPQAIDLASADKRLRAAFKLSPDGWPDLPSA